MTALVPGESIRVAGMHTRTLVICGDDDPLVPLVNARMLAHRIPGARLEVVPGAGHLLLMDSTELVGPLINDFL